MSAASLVVLCLMLCLWDPTMLLTVRSSLASLVVHNNRGFSSPSLSIRGVVPSDGNDARQPERTRLLKSRFRSFARCSLTRSQPLQQKDRQGERKKATQLAKRARPPTFSLPILACFQRLRCSRTTRIRATMHLHSQCAPPNSPPWLGQYFEVLGFVFAKSKALVGRIFHRYSLRPQVQ